jgi:prephenate dehydrogenase
MAGSEQTGFSAARADLFEGAAVIVTPTTNTQLEAERRAKQLWEALGAKIFVYEPKVHDCLVGEISHLPHFIAAALVNHSSTDARKLAGGGFIDTTRVASGSPELWTEILFANNDAVTLSLRRFISDLEEMHNVLESASTSSEKLQLRKYLESAQHSRSQLLEEKRAKS